MKGETKLGKLNILNSEAPDSYRDKLLNTQHLTPNTKKIRHKAKDVSGKLLPKQLTPTTITIKVGKRPTTNANYVECQMSENEST